VAHPLKMSDPRHKNATNTLQFSWGCWTVGGWAFCILSLASLLACTTKPQPASQKPKFWPLPQARPLKVQPFVQGRIITVNPSVSAAVGWFTPGFLPSPGLEFYAIRNGTPSSETRGPSWAYGGLSAYGNNRRPMRTWG